VYYSLEMYEDEEACTNFVTTMYINGNIRDAVEVLSDRLKRVPDSPMCRSLLSVIAGNPTHYVNEIDGYTPKKLRYSIIVMCTYDTPILRASLRSIRNSDYTGDVILSEDGDRPEKRCEELAREYGYKYIKHTSWIKSGKVTISAAKDIDCDIVIVTHSDVLFPQRWFEVVDRAWNMVYDTNKVGMLNVQYYGYISGEASTRIKSLYNSALQEPIEYICTTMRDKLPLIRYSANRLQYNLLGMGKCEHNDKRERYMAIPTMMSPCYTINKKFLDKIDNRVAVSSEINIRYLTELIVNKMWEFTITTPYWIHQSSTDIDIVVANNGEYRHEDFENYTEAHGFDATHVLCKAYSGIYIGNEYKILRAANTNRFEDIDYLFDVMEKEILEGNCDNCDIQWCHVKGHTMGERTLSETKFRRV